MSAAEEQIRRRQERDREILAEIERTESSITVSRERTEQALGDAQQRLERIEMQAGEAEERAARAERLANLRREEAEREHRLQEMLERIDEAERRAREAERRAREAVVEVSRPLRPLPPLPPERPPAPPPPLPSAEAQAPAPAPPAEPPIPEGAAVPIRPGSGDAVPAAAVSLNSATFEQLRAVGLSVTQTGRVLAYRERSGGFSSVEELGAIPGFSREFLDSVSGRLQP